MSVRVDRVLGFMLDMSDVDDKKLSKLAYDEPSEELKQARFADSYSGYKGKNIVLLYDGMSGEYAYLVWVVYGETDCEDYYDSDFYNNLNTYLEKADTPQEIEDDIRKVLKILDCESVLRTRDIRLRAMRHYH